ncbi:SH3 domain-containing protein [Variovorax sp.]|uniref:SH3 domain-containing protein n=1 Tax=Variovorax sp. TaxID=1871043 RepID=UPI002D3F3CDA|nr:SH3 domain-containing protein [Variovorax sp.]HYP85144.1 SH3 domain-containing protein [Variovorax sp.]
MEHKNIKGWIRGAALSAALAVPLAAAAQQAYTTDMLNLRAGPGVEYPVVAVLSQGQPLDVMGCQNGYDWCDVVLPDGQRGWVAASFLQFPYQGAPVPLTSYAPVIGVPIVTFALGSYWGSYYRDRSWYNEPRWWHGRPPPPSPGWRPPPPPRPGWQPHPPPPNWRPPQGRPSGWNGGPRPGWDGQPGHGGRPPNWNGQRPDRPDSRPPNWNGQRPDRPDSHPPGGGGGGGGGARPDRPHGGGGGQRPPGPPPGRVGPNNSDNRDKP